LKNKEKDKVTHDVILQTKESYILFGTKTLKIENELNELTIKSLLKILKIRK